MRASEDQETESGSEGPIMMSSFQVQATENKGYITKNSSSALKTDESLLTVPQAVLTVTREMITDTGYAKSSDVLAMAGVANNYRGETYTIRGVQVGGDLIDELPNISAYMDNEFVDSYEVIRGPTAVFYPTASLGGIVLKTTRKPLNYTQNTLSFRMDQWGQYRAEADSTGPVGKLGNGVLAYRMTMSYQDGGLYYDNFKDKSQTAHPSLQWTNGQSRVLVAFDYQKRNGTPGNGQAFLNPDGTINTDAGRRAEAHQPVGGYLPYRWTAFRAQFAHKIGTDWEMKTFVMLDENQFQGAYISPTGPNFITHTVGFTAGGTFAAYKCYDFLSDFTGKYHLFGIETQSTFGVTFMHEFKFTQTHVPPTNVQTTWSNIPFSQASMDYLQMPSFDSYKTTVEGGGFVNDFTGYYQQSFNFIPDRLSGVVTGSWRYIESDGITQPYVSYAFPFASSNTILSTGIYRLGFVFQLIPRKVVVYGLKSTQADSNGNNLGVNGLPLPPRFGYGMEAGVKTQLMNGRITSTTAVYDIELTNVATFVGTVNGVSVAALIGKTIQKGWDTDLSYSLGENFEVLGTYYFGSVRTQANLPVPNSIRSMWSLFGRYTFPRVSKLSGLVIGGGGSEIIGRLEGITGYTLTPAQLSTLVAGNLIKVKPYPLLNAFANYQVGKHWVATLSVANILNANFAQGGQAGEYIDQSPPTTISGKLTYKF